MKTMNKKRTKVLAVMVAMLMVMQYTLFGALTVNAAEEEAGKTIASTLSVKYHFFAKGTDGNYGEVRSLSRSVKTGGKTTNITATTANNYVTPKSVTVGDKTYDFTNSWSYESGSAAAFPLSMTYDEAAGLTQDGKNVDVSLYAQYEQRKMPVKVTIHFTGIKQTNGTEKNTSTSNSISWGGGWNFTKKKLESTTGVVSGQSFSYGGCTYSYTGQWKDGNGNIIDGSQTISLKYSNGTSAGNTYYISEDTDLYFSPVYDVTTVNGLDLSYIDRVSTGSGSWSNKASDGTRSPFTTMTHTFKQPDSKAHYKFVEWKDFDANKTYQAGDAFSYTLGNEPANAPVKTVNIYALWQPSVTVNYNVLGKTVKAEESFDKVAVYDYEPESKGSNIEFTGWFDANGNRIDGLTVYEAPEVTGADEAVVSPEVKDVYAGFSTSYTVQKNWDDEEDRDGKRAKEIEVALIANGRVTDITATLSEENDWEYTFEDLEAYDENYELIAYGADETSEIYGYTKTLAPVEEAFKTVITNIRVPEITLTAASGEWTFDGEEHSNSEVEMEGWLFPGDRLEAKADGKVKDVQDTEEGNNSVSEYKIIRGEGADAKDVTDHYRITTVPGTLTITPREITVETGSDEKEYDGKALTNNSITVKNLAEADEEQVEYETTGSQTEIGCSDNTYTIEWNGTASADNYTIKETKGTLTVLAAAAGNDDDQDKDKGGNDNDNKKTSKATLVADTDKGNTNGGAGTGSADGNKGETLIADNDTPLAQIADDEAPLAVNSGAWALVNLIAMIVTILIGLAAAVMGFFGRNKEDDEEETEEKLKRKIPARILAAAAAVISVIVFILTEDMSLPMQMTDNWTIWMIIILAVGAGAAVLSKKEYEEEDEETAKA